MAPLRASKGWIFNWLTSILYILSVALIVGWLFERTYHIFQEYLSDPTYTEMLIRPQYEAEIPAVSVCPMWNGYKTEVLKVHF